MTLPTFDRILMADVLRDGGSYYMLLSEGSGVTTVLNLQVHLDEQGRRTGYMAPNLFNQSTEQRTELTWPEASALAQLLEPLCVEPIVEGGLPRARECLGLLARSGAL